MGVKRVLQLDINSDSEDEDNQMEGSQSVEM